MQSTLLISYAIAVAALIISPGPIVLLVISNSARGFKSATPTICGGVLASLLLITAALLSIHFVLNLNKVIFELCKLLGGMYLVWLGYKAYLNRIEEYALKRAHGGFRTAFLTGISNPKDIIFLLAFLPTFINPSEPLIHQSFYLVGIWLILDISIMTSYAEFSKYLFRLPKFRVFLRYSSSLILVLLGMAAGVFAGVDLIQGML